MPRRAAWFEEFEQLYKTGYTIVLADSRLNVLDALFKNGSPKFDGSPSYFQALRDNAEFIHTPDGKESSDFLDYAVLQPKKAIIVGGDERLMMLEILKIKFPTRSCGSAKIFCLTLYV